MKAAQNYKGWVQGSWTPIENALVSSLSTSIDNKEMNDGLNVVASGAKPTLIANVYETIT